MTSSAPFDPDVVVFTEVTSADSFEAIADVVGPHRAGHARQSGGEHPAIVSRWPIIHAGLLGPRWAPHKWVEATLQPYGGTRVNIVGVHLVPQPLWPFEIWRCAELRSLLTRLRTRAGTPQVIAGDFNALSVGDPLRTEGAPGWVRAQWALQGGWPRWALRTLTNAGYSDCYRACHEKEPGFTVPAWNPGVRIDYVFASASLKMSLRASGTLGIEHTSRRRRGAAPFTGRAARLEGGPVPRSRGVGSSAGVGRLRMVISGRRLVPPLGCGLTLACSRRRPLRSRAAAAEALVG